MSLQTFGVSHQERGTLAASLANETAVASTAAETALVAAYTMEKNIPIVGRYLHYRVAGQYSNTGTPTLTFILYLGAAIGGTSLISSGALTTANGVTASGFVVDCWVSIQVAGATGKVVPTMSIWGTDTGMVLQKFPTAQSTVDFTQGTTGSGGVNFQMSVTWSASSASNTITATNVLIELV